MKNLVLQSYYSTDIDLPPTASEDDDPVTHFCLDASYGLLYAVTHSGQVLCLADRGQKLLWSAPLFDPACPPAPLSFTRPLPLVAAAAFLLELDGLFVAASSGELLLLHTASHELEEVGVVSGGIAAAGWSPDGELLALLGFNQLLLLMNKEWDVLAEVPLPPPPAPAAAAGSGEAEQQLLSATLSWRGDSKFFATNTCWSSSSSSSSDEADSSSSTCHQLHVWDREDCQLHATGQAAAGLASAIAWQPNSRHLYAAAAVPPSSSTGCAGAARSATRGVSAADVSAGVTSKGLPLKAAPHQQHQPPAAGVAAATPSNAAAAAAGAEDRSSWLQHVLLYERNGLQHGGFDVPTFGSADSSEDSSSSARSDGGLVIQALAWSSDSELLAVVLAPAAACWASHEQQEPGSSSAGGTHEWHVQLWHRSNWHWYLKHEQLHCLPDSAGGLLVAWDELRPGRLHCLTGRGAYCCLDLGWAAAVSGRGTAAVQDAHQLLLTPLRHGLVPPPMCAVRALLPRPAVALAWLDGDIRRDLGCCPDSSQCNCHTAGTPDVVAEGLCEVLAVLLSDGGLVFLRTVESDLWEETLEDQAALGGPSGFLLPLGYSLPPAAATAAAAAAAGEGEAFLSMPSGPWTAPAGSSSSSKLQQQQRCQQQLLMLQRPVQRAGDGSSGGEPLIPPAEGRQVLQLAWLGSGRLLLLAAPYAEPGLEAGQGTVLVEVAVDIPGTFSPSGPAPEVRVLQTSYAGGQVLSAAAHPAGGALLQLQDGQLLHYSGADGRLSQLGAAASFPGPCRAVLLLPEALLPAAAAAVVSNSSSVDDANVARAARVAAVAPAIGLAASGQLYWGSKCIADNVVSVVLRSGGPGGSALLFVTRQALLYVVMVAQLPSYNHLLPDESAGVVAWRRRDYPGDLKAAMSAAMRPTAAAAAARAPHMRAVEPGAVLLGCPWGGVGAVLQMQRGNLEGVSPRLLVLAAVCEALDRGSFATAWDLAVTHRVDLNLLVDHAWPRFLGQAAAFVAAVPEPSDLVDLLLALRPGSVLDPATGLYGSLPEALGWQQQADDAAGTGAGGSGTAGMAAVAAGLAGGGGGAAGAAASAAVAAAAGAGAAGEDGGGNGGSKVAAVCAAVRAAVLALPGRFKRGALKTVVMSYARSDPPSLEAALTAIRDVKEASVDPAAAAAAAATVATPTPAAAAAVAVTPQEAAAPGELSAAADAALRFLLLYADVDACYRAALGLYDLPLAFMVVGHSQKDPGEYLAELTAFGSTANESLRRHDIDMSLRRYERALGHLVDAGPSHWKAALELAKERGLLRQLLALVQQQQQQQGAAGVSERLVSVLTAYGDSLMASSKAEDAAVAYAAAGQMEAALQAYKAAGAWRMALVVAARLGWSQAQQQGLARDLAEQLAACGAPADAAALLIQYLEDTEGGVAALTAAREWREALRAAYAAGRPDLVDTLVAPAAAQAASSLLSEAGESVDRLVKYSGRLSEVRGRRLALAAALAAAEADAAAAAAAADDDLVSEAPSMLSGFSMYTEATGAGTGIGGSSAASSSRAPSTVGGRKAQRQANKSAKKASKSGKIRAGSPGEELALTAHLTSLAPSRHVLEEAGQLAELLVLLQHFDDAAKLQQRVGQWQAAAAAALVEVQKGQQQQAAGGEQPATAGEPQQQPAAAPGGGVAGAAAGGEAVSWKWDVLRQIK